MPKKTCYNEFKKMQINELTKVYLVVSRKVDSRTLKRSKCKLKLK